MIRLEDLLTEAVENPPCGPNLEYDVDFLALAQAAAGQPERVMGQSQIPAVPPDWAEVRDRAAALLTRTKDLRVAVLLARALVRTEGVLGLEASLALIRGLVERYWDTVHPLLDPDDAEAPTMRISALSNLGAEGLIGDLRGTVLVPIGGHGMLFVEDAEVALGARPPNPKRPIPAVGEIGEALAKRDDLAGAVRRSRDQLAALRQALATRCGSNTSPDLKPLDSLLGTLDQLFSRALGKGAVTTGAAGEQGLGSAAVAGPEGAVRSRAEATLLLDKVCEYLDRHEPSNPAPLLIQRAKRLMTMSFVDIVKDLTPDSLAQIEKISGQKLTK